MSTVRGVTKAEAVARKVTGAISAFAITCVLIGAMSIVVDVLMRWIMNRSILALNEVLSIVFALAVIWRLDHTRPGCARTWNWGSTGNRMPMRG